MSQTAPARTKTRTALRLTIAGLVVAIAAMIATLGHRPASSSAPSFSEAAADAGKGVVAEEDGALPDGATVFDDEYPGVARLDPALLAALRAAATDAAGDGITFHVNSGWRSPEYQNELLREAVVQYGTEKEAARWVAPADKSEHVSGDAVDIGPFDASAWLSKHGVEYGLCQIYRNESWHFELRPKTMERGCPAMYADPTQDPRMHQ